MIIFISVVPVQVLAAPSQQELPQQEKPENSVQTTMVRKVAVKGAFYLLNRATQALTKREPSITLGNSRDTASSGTINYKKIGSVRKDIEAVKKGHEIEMWANSHQIGWTGKIVVTLSRPDSSKDAINRTVGHNQYSWFTVQKAGKHVARWTTSNSHSWTLWHAYYHWGDLHKKCDSKGNCMLPTGNIDINLNVKEDNLIVGVDESGNKVMFETVGEYRYMLPTEKHKNNTKLLQQSSFPNTLTMNELYYEYYDENLDQKVDISKNYIAGDEIQVTDTIIGLEYDSDMDATLFEFKSDVGSQYLAFKGDLTEKYSIGDSISFKFMIVSLHEGHEYTTINYTKVTNDGIIPDINEYLVK